MKPADAMSALLPKADIRPRDCEVRQVPNGDICTAQKTHVGPLKRAVGDKSRPQQPSLTVKKILVTCLFRGQGIRSRRR